MSRGMRRSSASSTARGVGPGAMPVRLPRRKIWVSTAMVAWPKISFSTTFAVLRPTPGSASSAARLSGTSPPWRSTSRRESAATLRALACQRPMLLISAPIPSAPKAAIALASGAAAKRAGVTLFTARSVVWAESTTATSS